jgi:hypothetical protein
MGSVDDANLGHGITILDNGPGDYKRNILMPRFNNFTPDLIERSIVEDRALPVAFLPMKRDVAMPVSFGVFVPLHFHSVWYGLFVT